jgi:hypothetical protein
MSNDKRNQLAGPAYEREIVKKINAIGVFPEVGRTAELNPELDKQKLDIISVDPKLFDEFVYRIQAKSSTRTVPYGKLLKEIEDRHSGVPVILHKQTKRVENDRFLKAGAYAILNESDFFKIIEELKQYKEGFRELHAYWDSISDEEKPKLHERLKKIGV